MDKRTILDIFQTLPHLIAQSEKVIASEETFAKARVNKEIACYNSASVGKKQAENALIEGH